MLHLGLAPLLVLVLGVSLGAAFPHDIPGKGCRLSQYQSIAPEQRHAVDRMRQEFVSTAGNGGLRAGRGQVLLVAAELNLTTAMLGLPAAPGFAELCREPLHFFRSAREAVQGCVSASPEPCGPPSGRLRHWLHKLQNAMRAVSQAGGLDSVISEIFPNLKDSVISFTKGDKIRPGDS
uniref:Uncharacterized protein n=1 Tax=Junco hyemalis TaxID=40217 RepID=A0A8C5NI60_JUNHY